MTTRLEDMTAVILAGGLGTRLREVVTDRPKVLAEINGRPFLAYLLDQLSDAGIKRVVLCTGYMAEKVYQAFGDSYNEIRLVYSVEETPLGTGGAVRLALPLITSDTVLVLNGDSFCDANLDILFCKHSAKIAEASLLVVPVNDISRYGAVDIDDSNAVVNFTEKGGKRCVGMINSGVYVLSGQVIKSIPPDKPVSLEHEIFPRLIGNGLYAFCQNTRFIDIGIPSDYYNAFKYLTINQ